MDCITSESLDVEVEDTLFADALSLVESSMVIALALLSCILVEEAVRVVVTDVELEVDDGELVGFAGRFSFGRMKPAQS